MSTRRGASVTKEPNGRRDTDNRQHAIHCLQTWQLLKLPTRSKTMDGQDLTTRDTHGHHCQPRPREARVACTHPPGCVRQQPVASSGPYVSKESRSETNTLHRGKSRLTGRGIHVGGCPEASGLPGLESNCLKLIPIIQHCCKSLRIRRPVTGGFACAHVAMRL